MMKWKITTDYQTYEFRVEKHCVEIRKFEDEKCIDEILIYDSQIEDIINQLTIARDVMEQARKLDE